MASYNYQNTQYAKKDEIQVHADVKNKDLGQIVLYSATIRPAHHPHVETHSYTRTQRIHITTISNTRIDKVSNPTLESHPTLVAVPTKDKRKEKDIPEKEAIKQNDITTSIPTPTTNFTTIRSPMRMNLPNTAMDPEFSYDYDTYMNHVANRPPSAKKSCSQMCQSMMSDRSGHSHRYPMFCGSNHNHDDISRNNNSIRHCSFGMELLDLSEALIVRQRQNIPQVVKDAFQKEGIYPWGFPYEVSTRTGSPLLYMTETTNCLNRMLSCSWIGLTRSFTARIVDVCGKPSMTVTNVGLNYCCCCAKCCCCCHLSPNNDDFHVTLANGDQIGSICQTRGEYCNPGFVLRDINGHRLIHARGPKCTVCDKLASILSVICCCFTCLIDDDVFYFMDRGGRQIAKIHKSKVKISYPFDPTISKSLKDRDDEQILDWNSTEAKQLEEDDIDIIPSHQILVDFSPGLPLKAKSMILAASFVIDFLYWQSSMDYASIG